MQIQPVKQLRGEVSVPGDKSISHRSIMFGALAKGTTEITHFLHGADCLSTIGCFRAMGINIEDTPDRILVHGKGLHGLSEPSSFLDVGNSGTTTRLISGILSGQPFATTLSGDASLNSRPMKRIMEPLGMMGAFKPEWERVRTTFNQQPASCRSESIPARNPLSLKSSFCSG